MKREIVNVGQRLHITQYGNTYAIAEVRRHGENLYLERPFLEHPTCRRLQLHILPAWGWQVCRYLDSQGQTVGDWSWYVDIVRAEEKRGNWLVSDLYLDVGVREGQAYDVLDLDEFAAALEAGELRGPDTRWALESLHRLVELLAANGYRMEPILALALAGPPQVRTGGRRGRRI